MRTVRVAFRDFWAGFEPEHWFSRHPAWLVDWDFELSDRPQLVIHSCFPHARRVDHVPAVDDPCLRLFYTAENTPTDLSRTDFALGFDRDVACERYLRLPNYVATQNHFGFAPDHLVGRARRDVRALLAEKQAFCAFVQGHSVPWRDAFVRELSRHRRVTCAGPVLNNTGTVVSRAEKYALLRRHKFTIAFENERARGYVTEKLNDALLADTLPIYAGDPSVDEDFERGAFLDLDRFPDAGALIEEILRLDADDDAYLERLAAPAYTDDAPSRWVDPERERAFAARVCGTAVAGRRWFWMGSTADGRPDPAPLELGLGPLRARRQGETQLSSDPLDQPDVCADEARVEGLAPGSVWRLRAPNLLLQWEPTEAVDALARWRELLAPDGRLELSVPDWEHCRRRAEDDPRGAFAALFAHGSRRAPRWGWTARELERVLAHAGFTARRVRPFGPDLRVRAAPDGAALDDDRAGTRDLLVGWPRFDLDELERVLAAYVGLRRGDLRLVLRHDPARDGSRAGALACLRRAARAVAPAAADAPLEVDLVGEPWRELCPFEIGARTVAVLAPAHSDPDRRRFLGALDAPVVTLARLATELGGRAAG